MGGSASPPRSAGSMARGRLESGASITIREAYSLSVAYSLIVAG